MSLCIAVAGDYGVLVASDTRASYISPQGLQIIEVKKSFVIDNKVIFVSGVYGSNMDVIQILQTQDSITPDTITKACRYVYEGIQHLPFVQQWEQGVTTIPISLNVFEQKDNQNVIHSFSPSNFLADSTVFKNGQTFASGIHNLEAAKTYKQIRGFKRDLESQIYYIEQTYRQMEEKYYNEIGGKIDFYLIQNGKAKEINK